MRSLWRELGDSETRVARTEKYPNLHLSPDSSVVAGGFDVAHGGVFIARYTIEVSLGERDNLGLPTVRETGGRIPRTPERHVNPDGTLCLYLPEALLLRLTAPLDLLTFLDGPVRTHFLFQACAEQGVPFSAGEWGHGTDGVRQLFATLIGAEDDARTNAFLHAVGGKVIRLHWACPCGSRRPIRDCHHRVVSRLRRLPLWKRRFLLRQAVHHLSTR